MVIKTLVLVFINEFYVNFFLVINYYLVKIHFTFGGHVNILVSSFLAKTLVSIRLLVKNLVSISLLVKKLVSIRLLVKKLVFINLLVKTLVKQLFKTFYKWN